MRRYSEAAWERAMKVQEVILRAMAKRTAWWQAAEILGISDRSLRRWKQRYEQHGYDGLFDRRRPSCRSEGDGRLRQNSERPFPGLPEKPVASLGGRPGEKPRHWPCCAARIPAAFTALRPDRRKPHTNPPALRYPRHSSAEHTPSAPSVPELPSFPAHNGEWSIPPLRSRAAQCAGVGKSDAPCAAACAVPLDPIPKSHR